MNTQEEVRDKIIAAASERFAVYGFGKTTMAEIGKDCDMSAANLYRFFQNKRDIAAALTERHFEYEAAQYREIVKKDGISAQQKIRDFVRKSIEITQEFVKNHEKIFEMLEFVCEEKKDLLNCHIESKRAFMAEILAEGNRAGEFDVDDIVATADAVLKAVIFFEYPAFMAYCGDDEIYRRADNVVDLLLRGLEKR